MLGFLTGPSPEGTRQVELPNQRAVVKEKVISLDSTREEEADRVFEVVDLEEEDFEVFDRPGPTESPGTTSKPYPSLKLVATKSQLTYQKLWYSNVRRTPVSTSYWNHMQEGPHLK